MGCKKAQRRLSAYLDGELSPVERAPLDEHVRGCARCTEELARLSGLRRLLDGAPDVPVTAGFAGSVRRAAEARVERARGSAARPAWRFYPAPARVAALAAVVLALALGGLMGTSVASVRTAGLTAAPQETEQDILADALDPLPDDSLAANYLELTGDEPQ